MPHTPVIFLCFANGQDAQMLNALRPEQDGINYHLARWQREEGGIVYHAGFTEPDKLIGGLNQFTGQISIFHYSGHADGAGLQLESLDGEQILLNGANLTGILSEEAKNHLKLVFLNACLTKGMVKALQAIGVSAIIATERSISDKQAKQFSVSFYRSLASGNRLETAFEHGKAVIEPEAGNKRVHRSLQLQEGEEEPKSTPWGLYILNESILQWKITASAASPELPVVSLSYYQKLPKSPFRNLLPFDREHAGIFFGRSAEIHTLYERINSIYPIILFYGQTGVGKSSLLHAGLLPRLEQDYEVRYLRREASGLTHSLQNLLQAESPSQIRERWLEIEHAGNPLIVILDQLEEAYTKSTPAEAEAELNALLGVLAACFDSPEKVPTGRLILSYRKEYHPEILDKIEAYALPFTEIFLKRLQRQGIVEAVAGITQNTYTSQKYGLTIESSDQGELSGIIADDLLEDAESSLAPVLQILLSRLWEHASDKRFSIALYQKLKKEGLLLQDFFIRQMETLTSWNASAVDSGLVLDVLNFHTTALGTAANHTEEEIVARYAHQQTLLPQLLQQCKDAYLLHAVGEDTYRLSHDTLAPIIQKAYEESDHPGQRAGRILESKQYDSNAKLDETDLATVEAGQTGMRVWNEGEQQLITASKVLRDKRIRQSKQRRRLALGAAIAILGFGVVAILFYFQAKQRKREGKAYYLAGLAERIQPMNPTHALQLAHEAYAQDSVNPQTVVIQTLARIYQQNIKDQVRSFTVDMEHGAEVNGASFSKSEDRILSWFDDGHVKLWDKAGNRLAAMKHKEKVNGARFSREEDRILSWSDDGHVKLWDKAGTLLADMKHEGSIRGTLFSQTEDSILSWSDDGHVKLWDKAGTLLADMEHKGRINGAIFSKDKNRVLSWAKDGYVKLWDKKGKLLADMEHEGEVSSASFSKTEDRILSWAKRRGIGYIKLWDREGKFLTDMKHDSSIEGVLFSRAENHILSWAGSHVKLWDKEGKLLADMEHEGEVSSASFSKTEDRILSWSEDGQVKLWNTDGKLLTEMEHKFVQGACFSMAEDQVISWSIESEVKIWSIQGELQAKMVHSENYRRYVLSRIEDFGAWLIRNTSVRLSRTDDHVISWFDDDNRVKIWSKKGKLLANLVHEGSVKGALFTQKGDQVLSWSEDGHIRLWDIEAKLLTVMENEYIDRGDLLSNAEDRVVSISRSKDGRIKLWSTDGRLLANLQYEGHIRSARFSRAEDRVLSWSRDGHIKLWSADGRLLADMDHDSEVKFNFVNGAIFSKAEDRVLSWANDGHVKLWSINGKLLIDMEHDDEVNGACFSKAEDQVLSWTWDGHVKLWSTDGRLLADMEHDDVVNGASFSKAEDRVLSWSEDGHIKLWDIKGRLLADMKHDESSSLHSGAIFSKAEDRVLSWAGDGYVKLWDREGKLLVNMEHESEVLGACFSQAENRVLSWSRNGHAKLWDIKGRLLADIEHKGFVTGAHFSQTEDRVLSWSGTSENISETNGKIGQVKLWNTEGVLLAEMEHEFYVNGALITPSQDQVFSWSADGHIKLWYTPHGLFRKLQKDPLVQFTEEQKRVYGIEE